MDCVKLSSHHHLSSSERQCCHTNEPTMNPWRALFLETVNYGDVMPGGLLGTWFQKQLIGKQTSLNLFWNLEQQRMVRVKYWNSLRLGVSIWGNWYQAGGLKIICIYICNMLYVHFFGDHQTSRLFKGGWKLKPTYSDFFLKCKYQNSISVIYVLVTFSHHKDYKIPIRDKPFWKEAFVWIPTDILNSPISIHRW